MIQYRKLVAMAQIRVGRIRYQGSKAIHPTYDGYTPIVVLTKSSAYGSLGPYVLTIPDPANHGQPAIFENMWQSYKLYPRVPVANEPRSRFDSTIVWSHPAEVHVENGEPNELYWAWRAKLRATPDAIRYPVGRSARSSCLCAITEDGRRLDYLQSRKQLYLRPYVEAVKTQPQFLTLKKKLARGQKLLIIEVDGPHQEKLPYYQQTYGVSENFIARDSTEATLENLQIFLNDTTAPLAPFGHGYCLAWALQGFPLPE